MKPIKTLNLKALNKILYILRKHGYYKDKVDEHLFAKDGVKHYRKGEVSDNTLQCVTIRQQDILQTFEDSTTKYTKRCTIISFDNCYIHTTEYAKAYIIVVEKYKLPFEIRGVKYDGDYLDMTWASVCYDETYKDIIDEIEKRLSVLHDSWK